MSRSQFRTFALRHTQPVEAHTSPRRDLHRLVANALQPLPATVATILVLAMVVTGCGAVDQASGRAADPAGGPPRNQVARGAALDVHTHLASQALTDLFSGGGLPAATGDDLIGRLDAAHVDRAVVLSGGYYGSPAGIQDGAVMSAENDFVADEVGGYPDRLIGFCGINPLFDNAVAEVDRCLGLEGMVGVKLHFEGSGVEMTDPDHVAALDRVFDEVEAQDAPVMIHVADDSGLPLSTDAFWNLSQVLTGHPTVRVAHAHCAGNTDQDTIELWLRNGGSGYSPDTSYVDVSACLHFFRDAPRPTRELLVWRFRKWGIDHVLFGSDYFRYDHENGKTPQATLRTLRRYPFTHHELKVILGNDGSEWLGTAAP